ncbi:MAG: aspartyl protease family protein [Deltaproteobacteria bacterium]|nr:aspartyl protease family protein [Deltaproteobacteria bacterium]
MICPKCGFSQPDDIYCALCGVNIERYARKKRKQRYKTGILTVLLGIAILAIINHITSSPKNGPRDKPSEGRLSKNVAPISQKTSPGRETHPGKSPAQPQKDHSLENQRFGAEKTDFKSSVQEYKQEKQSGVDAEKGSVTASQWFEKGKELDDDSEAEIGYYQKAIELDAKFVPALYRLGAIYYRQANYELADKAFAGFLEHATDADREAYDIYVYYSIADVQRLSKRIEEQAAAEEGEKETPTEVEKETGEIADEETSEETSEETGEEANEEVMTIVRFSQVDGHILVPVVLNDSISARVLVDTGAGITILSRELAKALGLDEERGTSITLKTMAMDIQAQLARVQSIQVGGVGRHNFRVAVTDLPFGEKGRFDGILGMDFLNNYKIQIDNETQRIMLTPHIQ